MLSPHYDFHIHTHYLGCGNATMQIPAIVQECQRLGVTALAITDHLHTLDKVDLHVPIREDIMRLETDTAVYFGVELNYTGCDQGFAYSEEIQEKYGFQFAIGGIHTSYLQEYDLRKLVDIQHRHHLKTCQDPLVQVLVHPYWFPKYEFERNGWPWFDSMTAVPEAYVRELGQASRDTGTAIEINGRANLVTHNYSARYVQEYVEFLATLAEEGAIFSLGSDAHDISHLEVIRIVWDVVEQLGLPPERIWRPTGAPLAGGKSEKR